MMRWLRRLRLMPAVIGLCAILFVVKSAGLARDAHADDGTHAASALPQTQSQRPSADPAADDAETTSADVDVLTSLSRRRSELDARERDLEMRQNLLAAAEQRVDEKIASLKTLQGQMKALLGERDAAQEKLLASLVKTYSSMKPRDAGRIMNNLSDDVLVPVAGQMKPDVLGAVLAQMQSEAAQKLTVKLAERLNAREPGTAPAVAPQPANAVPATGQSGSAAPVAAIPSAPTTPAAGSAPGASPSVAPPSAAPAPAGNGGK